MRTMRHEGGWLVETPRGQRVAREVDASLIALTRNGLGTLGGAEPLALWSGSYAEIEGGGLFDADPRTWSAAGWGAFDGAWRRAAGEPRPVVWVRPHRLHVVSDIPGMIRFASAAAKEAPGRFGVAIEPGLMVEPERAGAAGLVERVREAAEGLAVEVGWVVGEAQTFAR